MKKNRIGNYSPQIRLCLFAFSVFIINFSFHSAASELEINFEKVDWYAKHAAAAYASPKQIKQRFPDTILIKTTRSDVQYFMRHIPERKQKVIAIRGTDNFANAREDADYIESRNKKLNIRLHRGFDRDAYEIYQVLRPLLDEEDEIILTGHSLGAAISSILMMYFYEDKLKVGPSINFGQPKVTNKQGSLHYEFLPLTRVVDENDIVPLIPPDDFVDEMFGGYEHFGAEIILLAKRYFVFEDKFLARDTSAVSFWKNMGDESLKAHHMNIYLKNIKNKLEQSEQVNFHERKKYMDI